MISHSLKSDNGLYFNRFKFALSATVDVDKLCNAWQDIYRDAQILRTKFIAADDGHLQVALKDSKLPLISIVLGKDEDFHKFVGTQCQKWRTMNNETIFDPFRVIVCRSSPKSMMAVLAFHAVYDGISFDLILRQLLAKMTGEKIKFEGDDFQKILPYGPLQKNPNAKQFWLEHLSGLINLPSKTLQSRGTAAKVEMISQFQKPKGLELLRRSLNVTDYAVALACFIAAYYHHGHQNSPIGMVVSGRNINFDGAENTIGPLFNTIPFLARLNSRCSWNDLVGQCHDFNTSSIPFQHTSLRDILKWLAVPSSRNLFDSLFVYQKTKTGVGAAADNEYWRLMDDSTEADNPLAVEVEDSDGGLWRVKIVASTSLIDQKSCSVFLKNFQLALSIIVERPAELITKFIGDIRSASESKDNHSLFKDEYAKKTKDDNEGNCNERSSTAIAVASAIANLAGDVSSDQIDLNMSIFELGLDGIDAIKLSSRLKSQNMTISTSDIMRCQTAAKICDNIATEKTTSPDSLDDLKKREQELKTYFGKQGLEMSQVERILPATPLQEAMIAEMVSTDYIRYLNHDVLELMPHTDLSVLQRAWQEVIAQSPILRTAFLHVEDPDIDGSFAQLVLRKCSISWGHFSISDERNFSEIFEHHRSLLLHAEGVAAPLKLSVAKYQQKSFIVLTMSHALYDGFSLDLMHKDISAAYSGELSQRQSYDDFLNSVLISDLKSDRFWVEYLQNSSPTLISGSVVSDASTTHRKELRSQVSPVSAQKFCRNFGVTMQALGQACWSIVLAFLSGKLDVVFGITLSGRDGPSADNILFPTMNTIIMRSIIHGSRSDMVRYVQATGKQIRNLQQSPLRKIKGACGFASRDLFDSLFIFQPKSDSVGTIRDNIIQICWRTVRT